jgi:carbon-monoxide dehydrogenase small subunit
MTHRKNAGGAMRALPCPRRPQYSPFALQQAPQRGTQPRPGEFTEETGMRVALSFNVNGSAVSAEVEPDTLLSTFIREHLRLTGTHIGCDTGQCGACTVLVDGHAVKSCNVLAAQMHGTSVTTIEGITPDDGSMHPMQAAFKACHGLQCGFCTPGMVMSAIDLVTHHPHSTEREIREGLEGNFCRCTGYQNIVRAVAQGAKAMNL